MQEQKAIRTLRGLPKGAQEGAADADVQQYFKAEREARLVDYPYPNMSREPAESTEHIYMRIFGDAS